MKIQLFSDLHIEFKGFSTNFSNADVVVFAVDIEIGVKGIEWIKNKRFNCPVIYVLGNHEYYGQVYPKLIHQFSEATNGSNIHFLENKSVEIGGVRFHGAPYGQILNYLMTRDWQDSNVNR
jgi:Icc-related predicted phosphoesterase